MFDWFINFHFKTIMTLPKINEITWNQLVIIIIIACLCRSDCPISYYPEATFIGIFKCYSRIDTGKYRFKHSQSKITAIRLQFGTAFNFKFAKSRNKYD